jgi:hypothetical protein
VYDSSGNQLDAHRRAYGKKTYRQKASCLTGPGQSCDQKAMNWKHARTSRLRGPQLADQRDVCYHFIFPFWRYCHSHESCSSLPAVFGISPPSAALLLSTQRRQKQYSSSDYHLLSRGASQIRSSFIPPSASFFLLCSGSDELVMMGPLLRTSQES